jgi:DNA-binding transcriptional regulator YhcF (GntR family)
MTTPCSDAVQQADRSNAPKKLWRNFLKVHPAADLFPLMSADELKALGEDIEENGLTSPLVFWEREKYAEPGGSEPFIPLLLQSPNTQDRYLLLDGRNRLDAVEARASSSLIDDEGRLVDDSRLLKHVLLRGYGVDAVDPYAFVISANIHRRHLTAAQKIELVQKIIKLDPGMSSRRAAKLANVSPTTAAKARQRLEQAGDVSTVDTSIDTRGRKQPAKRWGLKRTKSATKRAEISALNTLSWSEASLDERRHFISGIGLSPILVAMPPEWKSRLRDFVNQDAP